MNLSMYLYSYQPNIDTKKEDAETPAAKGSLGESTSIANMASSANSSIGSNEEAIKEGGMENV